MMYYLKEARKSKGMTQEQLASALGVKRSLISKYESGTISPTLAQNEKIAKILGISIEELLTGTKNAFVFSGSGTRSEAYKSIRNDISRILDGLNDFAMLKVLEYIKDLSENPKYLAPDYYVITGSKNNK